MGFVALEVFTPQGRQPLEKWKISGSASRVFDKEARSYVVECAGAGGSARGGGGGSSPFRMCLPKDPRASLGVAQPFLLLQL